MREWTLVLIMVCCATAVAWADPVTIGFEGVAPAGGSVMPVLSHTEGGFTLSNTTGGTTSGIFSAGIPSGIFGGNDNGSDFFGWCGSCSQWISLGLNNSSVFSLHSIDFSNLNPGLATGLIQVTGFFEGGGTIVQTVDPVLDAWTTFTFSGFTGVIGIEIKLAQHPGRNVSMDNIVVSHGTSSGPSGQSVPEPASLLLLAVASALLGFTRRFLNRI